ncbi:MAG: DUF3604 domain-containing protein, partial [Myxococcota bacterium]
MNVKRSRRGALMLVSIGAFMATPSTAKSQSSDELVTYTEARQPCEERFPLRKALFGEFHLHSSYSFDAFAAGTRNDPEAALAFARGEPITLVSANRNETIQLSRPLDFAAVTDHAEFLGVFDLCLRPGSPSFGTGSCLRSLRGPLRRAREEDDLVGVRQNNGGPLSGIIATAWTRSQQAVEAAYDRTSACSFTAFNAFEYSAIPNGNMNHRNVIFRNSVVPDLPVGFLDEDTPQGLWNRLDAECTNAGNQCDVLAIPHNPNFSSGILFDLEYGGLTDPAAQAAQGRQRARLEPLVEIYQHKGASECSPAFSSDEQCGFEIIDQPLCQDGNEGDGGILTGCTTPLNFVRGALAQGLAEKERIGVNPFKLGIVASTDSHNGNPGNAEEQDWVGHVGNQDSDTVNSDPEFSPGGLVGVWSVENSRDAIFEALRRRETFGTSGPRIQIRLFAGWDYPQNMCRRADAIAVGYQSGVPMGGTVDGSDARSALAEGPTFVLQALNDQTPLQVAQIVKLWIDGGAVVGVARDVIDPFLQFAGRGVDPQLDDLGDLKRRLVV